MSNWMVQISAGTGPAEVRAFAARLGEHVRAVCAQRGLRVARVTVAGAAAAPRSVTLEVAGPAPALLADYTGTHALIARAPRRGRRARKRWFAGVSVHAAAAVSPVSPVSVDPADVVMTAARASGPGGQNVNRRASAVRAVHRPTRIAVRVTDERSQHANRRRALDRLAARIADRAAEERAHHAEAQRRAHYAFARGQAIRTWRLGNDGRLVAVQEA